jgi:hypothetical protein
MGLEALFKFLPGASEVEEKDLPKEKKSSKEERQELEEVKQFMIDQYENHPLKGMEHLRRAYQKAFIDGYHYLDIGGSPDKLQKVPWGEKERYRSRVNLIKRNQLISVAKVMKDEPVLRAVPAGISVNDLKTARISNIIFDNLYAQNEIDLTGKTYIALKTAYANGTAWFKPAWNPLLKGGDGDIQISIHDDFEILPDPSATTWWDMEWCLHAYLQDIDKLERLFKGLKGRIKPWHNNPQNQERNIYTMDYYYNNHNSYKNKAFVLEFVSRSEGRYRKGKKAILINLDIMAKYGDNPYHKFGRFFSMNYVPLIWEPVHGRLHGMSAADDQIPLNKEVDKICSLTMENIIKTAAFKIGLPMGSSVKATDMESDKVHTFYFNPTGGGRPEVVQVPSMPSYIREYLSFLSGTMQDVGGVHEVSMGQLPERGSQMSGSALKLLQDSEMVSHSPVMRSLKSTMGILGQFVLKMAKEYYVEERIINIAGEGRKHEVVKFKNSDLDGAVDVKLQIGSAFNTSAAAKVEGIMSLYEKGIIQDSEKGSKSAKKVLQALEFGQIDEVYQLDSAHERRAQWVIETIVNQRKVPKIEEFDNHEIHIRALEEFMLNPDFEEKEEELKNIFRERWKRHKELLAQQQQQQQPGGDTPPPPPPGGAEAGPAMPSAEVNENMMLASGPPQGGGMPVEEGMQ